MNYFIINVITYTNYYTNECLITIFSNSKCNIIIHKKIITNNIHINKVNILFYINLNYMYNIYLYNFN